MRYFEEPSGIFKTLTGYIIEHSKSSFFSFEYVFEINSIQGVVLLQRAVRLFIGCLKTEHFPGLIPQKLVKCC